jgi:small-conductance mechanosensitive channel
MSDLLTRVYFGNPVSAWLIALATAAGVFALLVAVRWVISTRVAALAKRTTTAADDALVDLLRRTKVVFLIAIAVFVATRGLSPTERIDFYLRRGALLLTLVQVGVWIVGLVTFFVERSLTRRDATQDRIGVAAVRAMGVGAKVIASVILIIVALDQVFGFNVTVLVTGLGVGGIALALAVQNILGDLLAALAIVFDRPFDVGDTIAVENVVGTVEQIGLKTTRLRSVTGEQVILSNGDLLKSRLRNYRRMYQRRALFHVDVTYETPPDVVREIPDLIRTIVERQSPVQFDRSHFVTFLESALRIETVYFVLDPDYGKAMDIQQAINIDILKEFAARGIRFAHPTRTVHTTA